MKIGVPKEIKPQEGRVGLTPASVSSLVQAGHHVIIETKAGLIAGYKDEMYEQVGATIVTHPQQVFAEAELIVKIKEPQLHECAWFREDQILFTYLHLVANQEIAEALIHSHCVAFAYETLESSFGHLPLLAPMSEVAGRMAVQEGAKALGLQSQGKGILLGGVPGVLPGRVLILGAGMVGQNALQMAVGLGAEVTIMDTNIQRLREINAQYGGMVKTLLSTEHSIREILPYVDLVIGAVLHPGAEAPKLIRQVDLRRLERGTVLVDVAIDQGGCFETSKPTTHSQPTFVVEDIVHYCVANMPGAVPRTSTLALNNATLPYIKQLAQLGVKKAVEISSAFASSLNLFRGKVTHVAVANFLNHEYIPPRALWS